MEDPQQFFYVFQDGKNKVISQLEATKQLKERNAIDKALEECHSSVQELQGALNDVSAFEAAYDLQRYQEDLRQLFAAVKSTREELVPQKKFSFGKKKKAEVKAPVEPTTSSEQTQISLTNTKSFQDLKGQVIVLKAEELTGEDITLRCLEDCDIYLLGEVGALHMFQVRRCSIWVVGVGSSALMYECSDLVMGLAARQLRVHDSTNMCFYINMESLPVIERCSRVFVSSFNLECPQRQAVWEKCGFALNDNWKQVQDFNWHKRQASPNWRTLPAEHRREVVDLQETIMRERPELQLWDVESP